VRRHYPAALAAIRGHIYRVDRQCLEDWTHRGILGRANERSRSRAWRYCWALVIVTGLLGWVQSWGS